MAKTSGIIKIEGTIDDLTFYKKGTSTYVRKKGGVNKERINSDPNFVRTRENNNEFSHNVSQAKMLRMAMGSLTFKAQGFEFVESLDAGDVTNQEYGFDLCAWGTPSERWSRNC